MLALKTKKQGTPIFVDASDYKWLSNYTWGLDSEGYAITTIRENGKQKKRKIHRMIMNAQRNQMVDHINGDKLDNRRSNLRFCTNSQNQANATSRRGKSRYKGVHKLPHRNLWQARIQVSGERKHLGLYKSEKEAALEYDKAAFKYHGEFAKTNILTVDEWKAIKKEEKKK